MKNKILKIGKKKFIYKNFNINYLYSLIYNNNKIIITGGSSIEYFLKKVLDERKLKKFRGDKKKKLFYLSDERLFAVDELSNSYKIKKIFENLPKNFKFFELKTHPKKNTKEMMRYEKLLPNYIDLTFLSLGKSYHLASLFPKMKVHYRTKNLILSSAKGFQYKRISINKHFLSKSKKIYIFINGKRRLNDLEVMVKKKLFNNYFSVKIQKKIILIFRNIRKK